MHKIISFNSESPTAQKTRKKMVFTQLRIAFSEEKPCISWRAFTKGQDSLLPDTDMLAETLRYSETSPDSELWRLSTQVTALQEYICLDPHVHRAWMPSPPGTEAKCTSPPLCQPKHRLIWSSASAIPPMLIYIKLHYKQDSSSNGFQENSKLTNSTLQAGTDNGVW